MGLAYRRLCTTTVRHQRHCVDGPAHRVLEKSHRLHENVEKKEWYVRMTEIAKASIFTHICKSNQIEVQYRSVILNGGPEVCSVSLSSMLRNL